MIAEYDSKETINIIKEHCNLVSLTFDFLNRQIRIEFEEGSYNSETKVFSRAGNIKTITIDGNTDIMKFFSAVKTEYDGDVLKALRRALLKHLLITINKTGIIKEVS